MLIGNYCILKNFSKISRQQQGLNSFLILQFSDFRNFLLETSLCTVEMHWDVL